MNGVAPLWGICGFELISEHLIPCRAQSRIPDKASSVLVACFPYLLKKEEYESSNISKYAVVEDYHNVVIKRLTEACNKLKELFPYESFEPFADNSPIPEVRAACFAGLGKRGVNSLLITEEYGSYVFIGEIVTTLKIQTEPAKEESCIGCGKCVSACPAQAISSNGINRKSCLSEITQKKGELSDGEVELMKKCGCVWGCDICQDVCPMNARAATTPIDEFIESAVPFFSVGMPIENRAYEWRGRKVIERNLNL